MICDNVAYASFSSQVNEYNLTKSATAHNISLDICEYKQPVNVPTFLLLETDQWEQRIFVWLARRRGPLCVCQINEIYFCLNFVTNVLQFLIARGFFYICKIYSTIVRFVSFRWCWVYLLCWLLTIAIEKSNPSKTSSTKYMLCLIINEVLWFWRLKKIFYYSLDFVMPFLLFFLVFFMSLVGWQFSYIMCYVLDIPHMYWHMVVYRSRPYMIWHISTFFMRRDYWLENMLNEVEMARFD